MTARDNPRRLRRVVIKEEFVDLTGSFVRAAILGQLEYWQERVGQFDRFIAEERRRSELGGQRVEIESTHGWIYKSSRELARETMLELSPSNMRKHIKHLIDEGWILERNNPTKPWDRTKQYRLDLYKIATDLSGLGHALQGWNLPDMSFPEPFSKTEHGSSKAELGRSDSENGAARNRKAIPETTAEITYINKNPLPSTSSEADGARGKPKRQRTSKGTIKGLTDDEAAVLIKEAMEGDTFREEMRSLVRLAASENKTGEMKYTRVWNSFVEPYVVAREREGWSDESWRYGFSETLRKEKASVGYVTSCVRNHHDRTSAKGSGRAEDVFGPRKGRSSPAGTVAGADSAAASGANELTEKEKRAIRERHERKWGKDRTVGAGGA